MNRPAPLIRLVGWRPLGIILIFMCIALMVGWFQNNDGYGVPWWAALVALVIMVQVFKAMRQMRRYKLWAAEWEGLDAGTVNAKPVDGNAGKNTSPQSEPQKKKLGFR